MKIIKNTDFLTKSLSETGEVDRISDFPDEILEIILSFVDLNQAVRTGILSKRWKNTWVSMPKVDFDFGPYFYSRGRPDPKVFNFPDKFLTSIVLRELTIRHPQYGIIFPRPFVLPNLKVLYLEGFRFYYDDDDPGTEDIQYHYYKLPKEPFSGFSNLEKLTLDCCYVDDLIISAPKLRILELSVLNRGSWQPKIKEISAHQLTSLRYQGGFTLECEKLHDCPCLEELCLDMHAIFSGGQKGKDRESKKMAPKLIEMLERFGNHAKFVTFMLNTIEILAADNCLLEQSPSPFPNLKHLKFERGFHTSKRMKAVPTFVMNYLTKGCSYDVSSSYDLSSNDR